MNVEERIDVFPQLHEENHFMRNVNRRHFLRTASKCGLAASSIVLWTNPAIAAAMASAGSLSGYKAVVLVTLQGGNDGNNMIVPLDTHQYASYAAIRQGLALPQSVLLPLQSGLGATPYGLHPALRNVASLYNARKALVVANVGPLPRPADKVDVQANANQFPGTHLSHPDGIAQWESAQAVTTGWGGRIADYLAQQSGNVPPLLSTYNSVFNVGKRVQAVAIQSGAAFSALPADLNNIIANIAHAEQDDYNHLVQQAALLRSRADAEQKLLDQAANYATLRTLFGSSQLSQGFKAIAQIIAGRSVTGALREIFYLQHRGYDHHTTQLSSQNTLFADFDQSIASFFAALSEMGLQDQVMVITHSDFGRTLQPNTSGGSDHAWGNHQLMLGGGIVGGRIAGTIPDMSLGLGQDLDGLGTWIPTQSVVQMTGGVGTWLGLTSSQVADVFPDLANFPAGAIRLV